MSLAFGCGKRRGGEVLSLWQNVARQGEELMMRGFAREVV